VQRVPEKLPQLPLLKFMLSLIHQVISSGYTSFHNLNSQIKRKTQSKPGHNGFEKKNESTKCVLFGAAIVSLQLGVQYLLLPKGPMRCLLSHEPWHHLKDQREARADLGQRFGNMMLSNAKYTLIFCRVKFSEQLVPHDEKICWGAGWVPPLSDTLKWV